jgi:hypothetical protein
MQGNAELEVALFGDEARGVIRRVGFHATEMRDEDFARVLEAVVEAEQRTKLDVDDAA